jgi:S-adenosylmethionine hydrolase
VADRQLTLVDTYATASGPSAVVASSGFVEIATPNGDAALVLGAGPGDRVRVV